MSGYDEKRVRERSLTRFFTETAYEFERNDDCYTPMEYRSATYSPAA
jgi:hypothetical protein